MTLRQQQIFGIIARLLDGEIDVKEACKLASLKKRAIYYWIQKYQDSLNVTEKTNKSEITAPVKKSIKDEVANEDEISRLSTLSKEELIDEVIKAKVGEARAKKGYEVRGGGANKEYVILNNKNTK